MKEHTGRGGVFQMCVIVALCLLMGIIPVFADTRDNGIVLNGSAGSNSLVVTIPGTAPAPTMGFTGTPTSGMAPLTVTFTDTSINTPTGRAWFFGDEKYRQAWTRRNPGARWPVRYGHSSVMMPDGRIVLTGGFNNVSGLKKDVWQSTDNGVTWTLVNASASWPARSFHSSVAMPDGSIVLMGGFDGSSAGLSVALPSLPPIASVTKGFADAGTIRNDVWRSTDNGATWSQMTGSAGWSARSYHNSVVMPDGSIVLMGGADTTGLKNDVWRSTDKGATWSLMNASAGWPARSWQSSVVMPDGSIVLTGGATDSGVADDVWRSTDKGATWSLVNASAGWPARYGHTSVAMPDGSIVLMGGFDGYINDRNDVWRSTDNGATWSLLTGSTGWSARFGHTSMVMRDGSILTMGGFNTVSGLQNDVWRMVPTGSSAKNPVHTYATPGTYRVALQGYNSHGYNSIRKTDYITVTPPALPIITSITPASGYRNTTVSFTIRGTNFQPGFTRVVFRNQSTGSIATTLNSVTLTQVKGKIAIPINASPGLWNIQVFTAIGGRNTSRNVFTVRDYGVPAFTAIRPAFAFQNTTVRYSITGRNFRPGFTTVRFRNATGAVISRNTLTKVTATQIDGTLVIPKNARDGAYTVIITTVDGGSVSKGNAFTLYSLPDPSYPINSNVLTTVVRRVNPIPVPSGSPAIFPYQVSSYATYGYGRWNFSQGIGYEKRTDLMPPGYTPAKKAARLMNFFTITDVHITDKESPVSAIFFGYHGGVSSAYSPVMLYTTQVLDAVVQTINVQHLKKPFDFGISLGDVDNSDQYNELRWYIDVLDGKVITPDSGVKDDPVAGPLNDYQDTFKAAGLNKTIRWYQTLGNHDHLYTGFLAPNDYFRQTLIGTNIINLGMVFNDPLGLNSRGIYMGSINGTTPYGDLIGVGPVGSITPPPKVLAADPDRRSITPTEWMSEFFTTSSSPVGHGFNQTNVATGFACYSFEPRGDIPLKVIVLDDTQNDDDPIDPDSLGYGHASLDTGRYNWLVNELDEGQADNKLMIIAAHIPIGVLPKGAMAGWSGTAPITESQLIAKLHTYPNLLLWISGHLHINQVTAFNSTNLSRPELGFWEVQTSSLRDYPQQYRTFEIVRNKDNTVSIFATDVDPSVRTGTPAATSRSYGVAAQQLFNNELNPLPNGTYNAELIKPLSPEMQVIIRNYGTPIGK